jgi:hypothetical protein
MSRHILVDPDYAVGCLLVGLLNLAILAPYILVALYLLGAGDLFLEPDAPSVSGIVGEESASVPSDPGSAGWPVPSALDR